MVGSLQACKLDFLVGKDTWDMSEDEKAGSKGSQGILWDWIADYLRRLIML